MARTRRISPAKSGSDSDVQVVSKKANPAPRAPTKRSKSYATDESEVDETITISDDESDSDSVVEVSNKRNYDSEDETEDDPEYDIAMKKPRRVGSTMLRGPKRNHESRSDDKKKDGTVKSEPKGVASPVASLPTFPKHNFFNFEVGKLNHEAPEKPETSVPSWRFQPPEKPIRSKNFEPHTGLGKPETPVRAKKVERFQSRGLEIRHEWEKRHEKFGVYNMFGDPALRTPEESKGGVPEALFQPASQLYNKKSEYLLQDLAKIEVLLYNWLQQGPEATSDKVEGAFWSNSYHKEQFENRRLKRIQMLVLEVDVWLESAF